MRFREKFKEIIGEASWTYSATDIEITPVALDILELLGISALLGTEDIYISINNFPEYDYKAELSINCYNVDSNIIKELEQEDK